MKITIEPFSSGLADLKLSAETPEDKKQLETFFLDEFSRECQPEKGTVRFRVLSVKQELCIRELEKAAKNLDALRNALGRTLH